MYFSFVLVGVLLAQRALPIISVDPNQDRFNYDQTKGHDYGPPDWLQVGCTDLQTCQWPDSWEMGIDWELSENSCVWCPKDNDSLCGTHHQSPIDLKRNRAIQGDQNYNECIDIHWMAYYDSSCTFQALKEKNAFTIERHALKIVQPLEEFEPNQFRLGCRDSGARRWGKIDFSKGFSHWWHLSHIDFHVPSEHTQEGKRYSGELQMYHWYSVNSTVAGVNNEMASVTIFLEADTNSADYEILNRIICQWRETEENVRGNCGLPSVRTEYPGCFFHRRGDTYNSTFVRRKTRSRQLLQPISAHDIILGNSASSDSSDSSGKQRRIILEEADIEEVHNFDWDEFISSQYQRQGAGSERRLINYDHVGPWFNYFAMLGVKTEYYYRYSGSQTVPPCYGKWFSGNNRRQTNHWRIMKDPIRVSQRQVQEMHRLLQERIDPATCQPDTAGKVDPTDPSKISVARPLQSTRDVHFKVFCECEDWGSKWIEDQEWCKKPKQERFYDHPYNYETNGF